MQPVIHASPDPASYPPLMSALSPSLLALQERLYGTCIGSYRIGHLIGYGGMGAVFAAQHQTLALQAAVKVLSFSGLADDKADAAVLRFLDEAQALSTVQHAGLVQLLDSGQLADGTVYILMEHLAGESLSARLGRCGGQLPLARALHLVRQVASALCEVHGKAIVHRDLTPSNLFLVPDATAEGGERVKLLDFGIAKIRSRHDLCTRTGECFGTPRYMAPEQCEGSAHIDDRADIYTLGVLLFELLAGRSPYGVESGEARAWMFAHVSRRPLRLDEVVPAVPAEISRLVAEMLDKVPAQRPSAAQVVMRLRRFARLITRSASATASSTEHEPVAAPPQRRFTMPSLLTRRRFLPTLTLLSALFCGLGFFGWSQLASRREPALAPPSAADVTRPAQQLVAEQLVADWIGDSGLANAAALFRCQHQTAAGGDVEHQRATGHRVGCAGQAITQLGTD